MANLYVVIPAAGSGSRMGGPVKKQYLYLAGLPVLAHTLAVFEQCAEVTGIVVVVSAGEEEFCRQSIVEKYGFSKVLAVVPGGSHRQQSVFLGLQALPPFAELVAVHDGARPLLTAGQFLKVVQAAARTGAATLAVKLKDTVKLANSDRVVQYTLPREKLWAVQTPQVFYYELIMEAHGAAYRRNELGTDDCSLVETLGRPVELVPGSYENIKITTPEDMAMAEAVLAWRGTGSVK